MGKPRACPASASEGQKGAPGPRAALCMWAGQRLQAALRIAVLRVLWRQPDHRSAEGHDRLCCLFSDKLRTGRNLSVTDKLGEPRPLTLFKPQTPVVTAAPCLLRAGDREGQLPHRAATVEALPATAVPASSFLLRKGPRGHRGREEGNTGCPLCPRPCPSLRPSSIRAWLSQSTEQM